MTSTKRPRRRGRALLILMTLSGCGITDLFDRADATVEVEALIGESVRVSIRNTGERPIDYERTCGLPFQELVEGRWTALPRGIACQGPVPVPISPGDRLEIDLDLPPRERLESPTRPELRVVVELHDEDGLLPLHMRTSEPFRLDGTWEPLGLSRR